MRLSQRQTLRRTITWGWRRSETDLAAALCKMGLARYGVGGDGFASDLWQRLRRISALEEAIAEFKGTEAALSFSTGYATALGSDHGSLVKSGDTVILDKLCHASLVDAARLSGATLRVFPTQPLGEAGAICWGLRRDGCLVVTESIFSMDGDAAALREIVELKDLFGAWLHGG
jgi:7-keto-8-aminopelargonate synthetase-like enzyme